MEKLKKCCKNCKYGMLFSKCEFLDAEKEKYEHLNYSERYEAIKSFKDEDKEDFKCNYECRYIEYPLKVLNGICTKHLNYKDDKIGELVKVRPCSKDENENKTYIGFYLGDLPTKISVSHNQEDSVLNIEPSFSNPAILVPELKRIVFGFESWWGFIKDPSELKKITDDNIDNVWYVKLLKEMQVNGNNE